MILTVCVAQKVHSVFGVANVHVLRDHSLMKILNEVQNFGLFEIKSVVISHCVYR